MDGALASTLYGLSLCLALCRANEGIIHDIPVASASQPSSTKAAYGVTPVKHFVHCKGDKVLLFESSGEDELESVHVYRGWDTLASNTLPATGLLKGRLLVVDDGTVTISDARPEDIGFYTIEIIHKDGSKYFSLSALYLAEPPATEEGIMGRLQVQQIPLPGNEGGVRLTCGHLTNRGFPFVAIQWQDPKGRILGSTTEGGGEFHLDLGPTSLSGNYTCRLHCPLSNQCCLPSYSPLLLGTHADVLLPAQSHATSGGSASSMTSSGNVPSIMSSEEASLEEIGKHMAAGMAALVYEQLKDKMESDKVQIGNWKSETAKEIATILENHWNSLNSRQNETLRKLENKVEESLFSFEQSFHTLQDDNEELNANRTAELNTHFSTLKETLTATTDKKLADMQKTFNENQLKSEAEFKNHSARLKETEDTVRQMVEKCSCKENLDAFKSVCDEKLLDLEERFGTQLNETVADLKLLLLIEQQNGELAARTVEDRVNDTFSSEMADIRAAMDQLKTKQDRKAAFRAVLGKADVGVNIPIPFGGIVEDLGNDYNPETGIFTAPYAGWYSFVTQLFPRFVNNSNTRIDLYHRGKVGAKVVARAYCYEEAEGRAFTCMTGVSLHLDKGDEMWVQTAYKNKFFHGTMDSYFSGFLVAADD